MNVFILTDLEGISGVTAFAHRERGTKEYGYACRQLEKSINLTAKTLLENGAEKIYYLDGHGGGGNVCPENIVSYAIKTDIIGWQKLIVEGKIDFQIELGSHARAGTVGGFLDHTINSSKWFSYRVGGKEYSELGIHALFCGLYNVPVVLCSGDEAACTQAKEYIPQIIIAPVKKASCRNLCTDYKNADEILKTAILKTMQEYAAVPPLKINYPATIALTYYRTDFCEEAMKSSVCNPMRTDARTLQKIINNPKTYRDLMF